jgi:hypothetical protein
MKWRNFKEPTDRTRALELQEKLLEKYDDLDLELSVSDDGNPVLTIPHEHAKHEGYVTFDSNGWYTFTNYELGPLELQDGQRIFRAVCDWLDRKWGQE